MKIKNGYNLRTVAGEKIVIPLADESRKNQGIFKLNEEGASLFLLFQQGAELSDGAELLIETYGASMEQAESDVKDFVDVLKQFNMIDE